MGKRNFIASKIEEHKKAQILRQISGNGNRQSQSQIFKTAREHSYGQKPPVNPKKPENHC